MSCCYRSSNCSGVTVFTIWSSLFFLACRQVVKSQLRHDYTASSSPFPRFRKFDAFPFPLQFRNSAFYHRPHSTRHNRLNTAYWEASSGKKTPWSLEHALKGIYSSTKHHSLILLAKEQPMRAFDVTCPGVKFESEIS